MSYAEHIQWIIDNLSKTLMKALSCDSSYKAIDNPFDIFLFADPTSKKKLTQWLVDTYIKGGFRWEDIQSGSKSKVFDTLSLYIKHKSKLDSANHIGQYDTLGGVYKDIASFIKPNKSSRSVKRDEQAKAYRESEVLVKSDYGEFTKNSGEFTKNSLTVVIPKTEYASKWWGRGTQWCTAGDKDNMFSYYYEDGPLIIIIVNGVKTQLHVDLVNKNYSVQFMDEHDARIDIKFVENNWKLLKNVMEWAIKYNGSILKYIPEILKTEELCSEAVRLCGSALEYVPKKLVTAELCLEAVKQSGDALIYVPENLMTSKIFSEAVENDGWSLDFIPELLKTAELCLIAVKNTGCSLQFVPLPLRTPELCLEAVKDNGYALFDSPESLRTENLYLVAVKQNYDILEYMPEHLITAELCLEVIMNDGKVLQYVPEHLITAELCLVAVRNNGLALEYVPEPLTTPELCLEAVKQNGYALRYIPQHLKTDEIYLEAVKQNGLALQYASEHLRASELCLVAVRQDGMALEYVPEQLITAELCLDAVKQNREALDYISEPLRTELLSKIYDSHKDIAIKWDFSFIDELKLVTFNNKY